VNSTYIKMHGATIKNTLVRCVQIPLCQITATKPVFQRVHISWRCTEQAERYLLTGRSAKF